MLRGGGENAELLGILILFGGGTLIRAQHYIYIYIFIYLFIFITYMEDDIFRGN